MTKKKILIVEDEAIAALDLQAVLEEDLGYQVTGTLDRAEHVAEVVASQKPDLVMMDISLKGEMDGIQAARQIWEESNTPSVFLTSYSDEKTLARANLAQPLGYILKPFDTEDLRKTLSLAFMRVAQEKKKESSDGEFLSKEEKNNPHFLFLKRVEPFRKIGLTYLAEVAKRSEEKSIEAGLYLKMQGEPCEMLFVVKSGRLSVLSCSSSGKEYVSQVLGPGQVYGIEEMIGDSEITCSLRCDRDSIVVGVPIDIFKKVLDHTPGVYREVAEMAAERALRSAEYARRLAFDKVEKRIAASLIMLLEDFGIYLSGEDVYYIDLTRQELSEIVGTTPETAIRVTKKMEAEGWLDLTVPSRIVLCDIEKLEEFAEL